MDDKRATNRAHYCDFTLRMITLTRGSIVIWVILSISLIQFLPPSPVPNLPHLNCPHTIR